MCFAPVSHFGIFTSMRYGRFTSPEIGGCNLKMASDEAGAGAGISELFRRAARPAVRDPTISNHGPCAHFERASTRASLLSLQVGPGVGGSSSVVEHHVGKKPRGLVYILHSL